MVKVNKSTIQEVTRLIRRGVPQKDALRHVGITKNIYYYGVRKEHIKAVNKKSYLKHRAKRLEEMRAYDKKRRGDNLSESK